jgi:simple sugar transport system permease protein
MRKVLQPVLAVVLGLAVGLVATWVAIWLATRMSGESSTGENPWDLLQILARGAFGTRYDFGMTLFYTTPLILTGLAVALPFQAGMFNIGAEGQLTMGALAAAAAGAVWPNVPWPLAPILAAIAAFAGGMAWGAIPGWLRARRGSHEVINTIMLNFIAAGLASYVTLYVLKNPDTQNPETRPVGAGYLIHQFALFQGAPLSTALPMALAIAALMSLLLWRTVLGYDIRVVGQSEPAARAAGIDPGRIRIIAMSLAGGLAGLVGVGEVLGNAGRFRLGFSPDFGFIGIAVALLGRNRPLGVVAAALLFGALHKGAGDLDLETDHVTRDLSQILQALVLLSVCADGLWAWMNKRGAR